MTDPIAELLEEHRTLLAGFAELRDAVVVLDRDGDAALPALRPALERVARLMATTLRRHARCEDEALFPAVEAALGAGHGPTGVMREEHRAIHAQAEHFRATLRQLEEVDHPRIVAGGERLNDLLAAGGGAGALARCGEEILGRIDDHFAREEQVLFPMARERLTAVDLAGVARAIAAIRAADGGDAVSAPGRRAG